MRQIKLTSYTEAHAVEFVDLDVNVEFHTFCQVCEQEEYDLKDMIKLDCLLDTVCETCGKSEDDYIEDEDDEC